MSTYKKAIEWIVANDDVTEVTGLRSPSTVTMALVADVFGKSDRQVKRDVLDVKLRMEGVKL